MNIWGNKLVTVFEQISINLRRQIMDSKDEQITIIIYLSGMLKQN